MSMAGLVGDPCYPDIKKALPPVPLGLAEKGLQQLLIEKMALVAKL